MITASPHSRLSSAAAGWRELWRDAITDSGELLRAARDNGYRPLLDSARELVRQGVTTELETVRMLDGGLS